MSIFSKMCAKGVDSDKPLVPSYILTLLPQWFQGLTTGEQNLLWKNVKGVNSNEALDKIPVSTLLSKANLNLDKDEEKSGLALLAAAYIGHEGGSRSYESVWPFNDENYGDACLNLLKQMGK
eukprot:Blabericola_migrator_1__10614@NODE_6039_length_614_cov_889_383912_g4024_i0_p1_GENE_NODE_6039_length_614_cov_889_383912_g4024_i0NODE_6039_length_614_cov_889_383912_g4024_i0_p1_ORF_typecomplete_len122_score24_22_NODE_6039_length_614_cov_889_383912_g4024_i0100465